MKTKTKTNKILSKRYIYLMIVFLFGIKFFGLLPFMPIFSTTYQLISIFVIYIFFGIRINDKFSKVIKWLLLSMVGTWLSSYIFEGQSILASVAAGVVFYHFVFYFIIAKINPSVREIENLIISMSSLMSIIYIIQYILLPIPILETVTTGWRIESESLKRFGIYGESLMILSFLLLSNRSFKKHQIHNYFWMTIFIIYIILHGYRSIIIAVIISYLVMFILYFRNQFSIKVFVPIFVFIFIFVTLTISGILDESIQFNLDRSKNQIDSGVNDIDRVMELSYFINHYLKSPFELIFGGGFAGDSAYGYRMRNLDKVNWVDLGFIGMSFLGGVVMVGLWIRLLIMTMKKVPRQYYYIGCYSLYIILSTITLNVAFDVYNIVVQCLVFFLFYKVYTENVQMKKTIK